MMYNYEAFPVLFNIFLFILMLYTFPTVYRQGGTYNRTYSESFDYIIMGSLMILYCTFGYADNDFYHYDWLFRKIDLIGLNKHFEPIYFWIKTHIANDYLMWRFIVWGSASVLILGTIKRLDLDIKVANCFLALMYVITLSVMRGNLGIAIMFFGFSFIVKPTTPKFTSYLFGAVLIAVSYFFHRSMLAAMAILLITPFQLRKSFIIVSLIMFPFLVQVINDLLMYIIAGNLQTFGEEMQIGSKMTSYAKADMSVINFNGMIARLIYYIPIVTALAYTTKKVVFENNDLPRKIYVFYVYWYVMVYVAFLFYFQETSVWLFTRFMMMAYFPMVIVLSHSYSNEEQTRTTRLIMILALLSCVFRLSYTFYTRLRFENLI